MKYKALTTILFAGLSSCINVDNHPGLKYREAYRIALVQNADTNKDGFISSSEKEAFDRKVFPEAKYMDEFRPIYSDGKSMHYSYSHKKLKEYLKNQNSK